MIRRPRPVLSALVAMSLRLSGAGGLVAQESCGAARCAGSGVPAAPGACIRGGGLMVIVSFRSQLGVSE